MTTIHRPQPRLRLVALFALFSLVGCAGVSGIRPRGLESADGRVDLARFMGDWVLLAHLPTATEENAADAVESYALRADGDIDVVFRFCDQREGEPRTLRMRAWVHDPETRAEWRVRPFWPLSLSYQILELDPDYRRTVIGHPSGRYAWVMARERNLAEVELAAIRDRLAALGYEVERWRRVPASGEACEPDPAEEG